MRNFLVFAVLGFGQMAIQGKQVVRLPANHSAIESEWGGKLVELVNAPANVYLPANPPRFDSEGVGWRVEVKNLGPAVVMIMGKNGFHVPDGPGQTIRISADGTRYLLK